MEERKAVITPTLAYIIEKQLNKCLKKGKVPSKRLLDTIEIFIKLI